MNYNSGITVKRYVCFGFVNACTINGKTASITNSIVENDLQILGIVETRHESDDDVNIKRITPDGFSCIDCPRKVELRNGRRGGAGGGIALVFNNAFTAKTMKFDFKPPTFEYLTGDADITWSPNNRCNFIQAWLRCSY